MKNDLEEDKRQKVSERMRAIKQNGSSIELLLRRALWKAGCRYRVNVTKLLGRPDIVFTKQRVAIFCDGEFWHGKDWERRKHDFKANKEFWVAKIEKNMERDLRITASLEASGWRVLRFWEKDVNKRLDECVERVRQVLDDSAVTFPSAV